MYSGRFEAGAVAYVAPIEGNLYRSEPFRVSLDADVTADARIMVFADGLFGGKDAPREMDIRLAGKEGGEYWLDSRADAWLASVNTDQHLEFALAISADALELFFTRADRSTDGEIVALHIYRAVRARDTDRFGEPSIVPSISGFVEAPSLSRDGRTMYFHKKENNRHAIYRVTR